MDVGQLRALVEAFRPVDAQEAAHRQAVLGLLDTSAPCSRTQTEPGHVTASAFVVNRSWDRVLLILHGKLGLWLQPGGHVDPNDTDIVASCLREVREETGLERVVVAPGAPFLFDIDVHDIPENPKRGEAAHRHYDVRLLLIAVDDDVSAGSDARDIAWVPFEEVHERGSDRSVLRALEKIRYRAHRRHQQELPSSPAVLRNREPILEVLKQWIQPGATVMEIASGTGEHATYLAPRLQVRRWAPHDIDEAYCAAVDGRVAAEGTDVVDPCGLLNVLQGPWPQGPADAVFCANMIHIAPPECTPALMKAAGQMLRDGGRLFLYGPFHALGRSVSEGNDAFDVWLKERDATYGVRHIEHVLQCAMDGGFRWCRTHAMPANNALLVLEWRGR